MVEKWKTIPRLPKYEASSRGRIRSARKVLKLCLNTSGYLCLRIGGRYYTAHSLIARAFLGPRPPKKQINHKDGVKTNNRPRNLEYVTLGENIRHARALGLYKYPCRFCKMERPNHRPDCFLVKLQKQTEDFMNDYVAAHHTKELYETED
jgi:hypothetical protein